MDEIPPWLEHIVAVLEPIVHWVVDLTFLAISAIALACAGAEVLVFTERPMAHLGVFVFALVGPPISALLALVRLFASRDKSDERALVRSVSMVLSAVALCFWLLTMGLKLV